MTFIERSERFPPCLVRLLARHKGGPALTTEEIAFAANLATYTVAAISTQTSWDLIPFGEMKAFLKGCNWDFCSHSEMKRVEVAMKRRSKFLFLKKSPEFDTVLRPLIESYRESLKEKIHL